jgi:hypothetical protein
MNNAQVIKKLASSPSARAAARDAANTFLKNVIKYPVFFSRCNYMIVQLPTPVIEEISDIIRKPMDDTDVDKITRILDDNTCAECGKVRGKCSHGAA